MRSTQTYVETAHWYLATVAPYVPAEQALKVTAQAETQTTPGGMLADHGAMAAAHREMPTAHREWPSAPPVACPEHRRVALARRYAAMVPPYLGAAQSLMESEHGEMPSIPREMLAHQRDMPSEEPWA